MGLGPLHTGQQTPPFPRFLQILFSGQLVSPHSSINGASLLSIMRMVSDRPVRDACHYFMLCTSLASSFPSNPSLLSQSPLYSSLSSATIPSSHQSAL
jgi:hypothetical protein